MVGRRIAVLLACHNRRPLTLAALAAVFAQQLPADVRLDGILVDDGSTDGTAEAVAAAFPAVRILTGDGSLYWNGAMARAQVAALEGMYDFHLWLNDDVVLADGAIAALLALHDAERARGEVAPIVVGGMSDPETGVPSYGGHVRRPGLHPFRFQRVFPRGVAVRCDTFNGNCVLVPRSAATVLGPINPAFSGGQPFGDTDYGLRAGQAGVPVILAADPVGTCRGNDKTSPWQDRGRRLADRLALLRGPLGPLRRQSVVFYRAHGGLGWWVWYAILCLRLLMQAFFPPSAVSAGPRQSGVARPRLAMVEPVLPWYRIGLVERLHQRGRIDLTVFHGSAHPHGEPDVAPPLGVRHRFGRTVYWPFGGDRVLWCNNIWPILCLRYDVVLMSEHVYTLSNWLIWAVSKGVGRPRVILTGHFALSEKAGGVLGRVRRFWVRSADFLAPYTASGERECLAVGVPAHRIAVLKNTIDIEKIRTTAVTMPRPGGTFLFIGRLYPGKRADVAVAAVECLIRRGLDARLVVVGDGEDRVALAGQTAADGPVQWLGAVRDPVALARVFAQAEAVVIPRAAGLAVVHAFAHGVPVILGPGPGHGVEAEYVHAEENGLWAEALTADSLADQMERVMTEPGLAERLRAGAVASADDLGMDGYTDRVEALVGAAARV